MNQEEYEKLQKQRNFNNMVLFGTITVLMMYLSTIHSMKYFAILSGTLSVLCVAFNFAAFRNILLILPFLSVLAPIAGDAQKPISVIGFDEVIKRPRTLEQFYLGYYQKIKDSNNAVKEKKKGSLISVSDLVVFSGKDTLQVFLKPSGAPVFVEQYHDVQTGLLKKQVTFVVDTAHDENKRVYYIRKNVTKKTLSDNFFIRHD